MCGALKLVVERLSDGAADIDLTEDRIETLAESRLRAARLYNAEAIPYLYIRVGVMKQGSAFTVDVSLNKAVRDVTSSQFGLAETWTAGNFGLHGRDAGYILQSVSELLDRFILEYLRVNEDACQQ